MSAGFHRGKCQTGPQGGFTLLEVILTMLVLSLLFGGVFSIINGTTQLASEVQRQQDRDAQGFSFAQLCNRTFRGLSGNGQVRLRVKQNGHNYLSELSILNAPAILGAAGNVLLVIETEQATSGYMSIVLKTYSPKGAQALEAQPDRDVPAQQRLVLLGSVARCEWRFLNSNTGDWEPVWNEKVNFTAMLNNQLPGLQMASPATAPPTAALPTGTDPTQMNAGGQLTINSGTITNNGIRPTLIELNLAFGADPPQRFVFWVPPAQMPSTQNLAAPVVPVAPVAAPGTPGAPGSPGTPLPSSGISPAPITPVR